MADSEALEQVAAKLDAAWKSFCAGRARDMEQLNNLAPDMFALVEGAYKIGYTDGVVECDAEIFDAFDKAQSIAGSTQMFNALKSEGDFNG